MLGRAVTSFRATLYGVVLLAVVATAFDITKNKVEIINLTSQDIVPQEQLGATLRDAKNYRFIGDLVIGNRRAKEQVFRRIVEVSNPTDQVYNSTLELSVDRGTIHYLSVTNEENSFAVACDRAGILGTSRTSFNVRVPPNTESYLQLLVAAH